MKHANGFTALSEGATRVSHSANQAHIATKDISEVRAALESAKVVITEAPGNRISFAFGDNTSQATVSGHTFGLKGWHGVSHTAQRSSEITLTCKTPEAVENVIREVAAKALTVDDITPANGVGAALKEIMPQTVTRDVSPTLQA